MLRNKPPTFATPRLSKENFRGVGPAGGGRGKEEEEEELSKEIDEVSPPGHGFHKAVSFLIGTHLPV